MDPKDVVREISRWIHVLAGITWIGHLYFFNWVNGPFAATLDADAKKKVVPELMPRALFWFRMGAALTWLTGVILLGMVYYMASTGVKDGNWGGISYACVALVFIAPFIYDFLAKGPLKDPKAAFFGGGALAGVMFLIFKKVGLMDFRGAAIHTGAMFGTIMAYNVWFRIWPNQRIIIAGVRDGQAVDAALAPLSGLRSKHNTYMSVPLVFTMVGQHQFWAAGAAAGELGAGDLIFPALIFLGFAGTYVMYSIAATPKSY